MSNNTFEAVFALTLARLALLDRLFTVEIVELVVVVFPEMKLASDLVGEFAPEFGCECGGVGMFAVAIALGSSLDAERLRKEVFRFLVVLPNRFEVGTGVFSPLLLWKSRSSMLACDA